MVVVDVVVVVVVFNFGSALWQHIIRHASVVEAGPDQRHVVVVVVVVVVIVVVTLNLDIC